MSLWTSAVAPLLKKLNGTAEPFDEQRLRQAFHLAEQIYRGKEHWTEVPLLVHALGVAQVLAPFEPDEDTVIACLLQHALQTRAISLSDIEEQFGGEVRRLVAGVHLLSHITTRGSRNSIEDLRVMLVSVSDDVRVILIILCERQYALEHLFLLSLEDKRQLAQDVLHLFAPVASRLGIHSLKQRLEALAFPVVYPADAQHIAEQLADIREKNGPFLPAAARLLAESLQQQGIPAVVEAREKVPFSIFNKMRLKSLSQIDKLPDLYGLRVMVDSEEQCYRTLGFLHRMGLPVTNRFKDYVAFPKPNGYRSLHTTIAKLPGVPESVFTEVQVRTHDMHREAEYGVAAHWSYKQGGTAEQAMQRVELHRVLTQQHTLEEGEGGEEALADHIFVLTPKGDIVELPDGATPLDFAFQIHTDLGIGFRASRVNGVIAPLDYQLENGDVVEVLTHRVPKPSTEWLQLLKMASSRSRLKRYLYALHRTEYVARGREMINEELRRLRAPPLDADLMVLRLYDGKEITFSEREDLLMKIGQGSEKSAALLPHVDALAPLRSLLNRRRVSRVRNVDTPVMIEGGVPMPMRFAKCCKPDSKSGCDIIGTVNRQGEVIVHRMGCGMIKNANPERRIHVWWRGEERETVTVRPKRTKVATRK